MKRVNLSSNTSTLTGRLIEKFFSYLPLLDDCSETTKYLCRISHGGENMLILYPSGFSTEDMEACLDIFIEDRINLGNRPELLLMFKKYIKVGIHHLAKPLSIEWEIDNYFINEVVTK